MLFLGLLAGLVFHMSVRDFALAGGAAQEPLTTQEKRGKQIYVRGTSSSGREILAYLGGSSVEVAGSAMPCANCHGLDGKGKPEGGITPSNLAWEALTKPYGVTHQGGRAHPAYTDRALELAISRGLDPAGNKLLNVMPRYQMSREDLTDLISYLKRLGKDRDPGLTENSITIGAIVPTRADLAGISQAIQAVTTAFFEEVNSQGGIYNRKIELKVTQARETPATTTANTRRFIQDERIFVMASAFIAGADTELATLMDTLEVPLVGPLTLYPQVGYPLNRHVFYILSGIEEQARALVNFASNKTADKKTGMLIVYAETEMAKGVIQAVKDECLKSGWGPAEALSYPRVGSDIPAFAVRLKQTGKNIIFFVGSGKEEVALLAEADRIRWIPTVYMPGALAGKEVFDAAPTFSQKLFFSFPTSPNDQTAEGINEFRAFANKYSLPSDHIATQILVYSSAKILVEGLRRAGKDVSREKLIQALEGLYEYPTGLTPAITYGPNRRVGAMGAYAVTIDQEKKQFLPASGWIGINQVRH